MRPGRRKRAPSRPTNPSPAVARRGPGGGTRSRSLRGTGPGGRATHHSSARIADDFARLATGLHPIAAALLALIGAPAAIPFVLLHGGGNGLLTIARGTLPLATFGAAGYGLRTGILAAPARILQGGAPLLFGLMLDRAGPYWALLSGSITAAAFLPLFLLPAAARPVAVRANAPAVR